MEGLAYLIGRENRESGLLARYLPGIPEGIASAFLAVHAGPGAWVLDPFGAAPRLDVEMARAGYRVLVAVNNPVTRALIELAADPPTAEEAQAALAELASARRGEERLETHIQSLYQTACSRCRSVVPAEAFLWERGGSEPVGRVYSCPCGESGEFPASEEDRARAAGLARLDRLHRSRALERVALPDDPDRPLVEEALECYLPRAVYVLFTLINKLDSLDLTVRRRRALEGLLLAACDEANTLWPHPGERPRPRQLTVPPRFLEKNIWLALERASRSWPTGAALPLASWSTLAGQAGLAERLESQGGVCLFEGPVRDLAGELAEVNPGSLVTVLPRPNQAFWTLSALWSGWLWGREAAAAFKPVLRRRRYDWSWHAGAMRAALKSLGEHAPLNAPFLALLPEAEAGFISAALLAAADAGFDLSGIALRSPHDPLQIVWHRRAFAREKKREAEEEPLLAVVREAMQKLLLERGEATTYLKLHTAGLAALAGSHRLEWQEDIARVQAPIQEALAGPEFRHFSSLPQPESGLWGLTDPSVYAEPLPDRVEIALVRFLERHPGASLEQIGGTLNAAFPGLQTPSLGLLRAVLGSYAVEHEGGWRLRPEDAPSARRQDLEWCARSLAQLAARLDFQAETVSGPHRQVIWRSGQRIEYRLVMLASAVVGSLLRSIPRDAPGRVLLLPGGRAGLLAYKLGRDPLLGPLAEGWRIVKFRQLRRLEQAARMDRETWEKLLESDPIEPPEQMKLF